MTTNRKTKVGRGGARPKRNGVPLTVYLSRELSDELAATSRARQVDKATIVRTALQRLFEQLAHGQLHLPLGL